MRNSSHSDADNCGLGWTRRHNYIAHVHAFSLPKDDAITDPMRSFRASHVLLDMGTPTHSKTDRTCS